MSGEKWDEHEVYPSTSKEPDIRPSTSKEPDVWPSTSKEPDVWPSTSKELDVWPSTSREPDVRPSTSKEPDVRPSTSKEPDVRPSTSKEPDVRPSSSRGPVRTRVFGARGKAFMPIEHSPFYQGYAGNGQRRSSGSGKWSTSGRSSASGKSSTSGKGSASGKSSTSGKGSASSKSLVSSKKINKEFNASETPDHEAGRAEAYEDNPVDTPKPFQKEYDPEKNNQGMKGGWFKGKSMSTGRKGKQPVKVQREECIPKPESKNEEDLFSGCNGSGINFDKCDNVEVTVSGNRIPRNIESFEQANLKTILMDNIRRCSYVKPTPVQKHALPTIMSGRDLMACAHTGSGKTAAFLIPTIQCLLERGVARGSIDSSATPQLLIVTPARELSLQIHLEAKKLTYGTHLTIGLCYGGNAFLHQIDQIRNGCNILIATPGRLLDFLARGAITLSQLQHLVIDEADGMLGVNFLSDIETILNHETINRYNQPQIVFFSATISSSLQRLARIYLTNYIFISAGVTGTATTDMEQRFFLVRKFNKKERLFGLLKQLMKAKVLIFAQKNKADFLSAYLSEKGFPTLSMHEDQEKRQRKQILRQFRSGKMDILVSTVDASKGLDIRDLDYIINYDLPRTVGEYIYRIGRIACVENRGVAFSFYDPETDYLLASGLAKILAKANQRIPPFLGQSPRVPWELPCRRNNYAFFIGHENEEERICRDVPSDGEL